MASTLAGSSFRDLEYVSAVALHLHFGQAAQACGVSQPALSAQILKLERFLGFALFERMPSGTRLTEDGAAFARRASDLLTAARDLLADTRGADAKGGAADWRHPDIGALFAAIGDPADPRGVPGPAPAVH